MTNLAIALILIISVITDLRTRKILNIITFPAILIALIYHSFTSGFGGLLFSSLGFLVGLGLLLIPFVMGGIGAGDVKLLAAVGAWKGTLFVLYTGVYGAVIGGLISLYILLRNKQLGHTLKQLLFSIRFFRVTKGSSFVGDDMQKSIYIPYAIPIAVGALLAYLMEAYV